MAAGEVDAINPTALRAAREQAGLSIAEVAMRAGVSRETVRRAESGASVQARTARRLRAALSGPESADLAQDAEERSAEVDGALLVIRAYERGGEPVRRILRDVARLVLFLLGDDGGAGRAA